MDPDGVLGRARLPLDRSDHCSSSIAVWSFSAKMTTKTFHYDYLIIWAVFDYCSFAALSRLTFTGICQQPQRIHFTGGADPRDQSPTRESQGIALRSYGAARRALCCCHPAADGECLTYWLCFLNTAPVGNSLFWFSKIYYACQNSHIGLPALRRAPQGNGNRRHVEFGE